MGARWGGSLPTLWRRQGPWGFIRKDEDIVGECLRPNEKYMKSTCKEHKWGLGGALRRWEWGAQHFREMVGERMLNSKQGHIIKNLENHLEELCFDIFWTALWARYQWLSHSPAAVYVSTVGCCAPKERGLPPSTFPFTHELQTWIVNTGMNSTLKAGQYHPHPWNNSMMTETDIDQTPDYFPWELSQHQR